MCGIAGIVAARARAIPKSAIEGTLSKLAHRGPDDSGVMLFDDALCPVAANGGAAFRIALLHRRLSIIDLSANGHQPMAIANGRCWISYNGEVYNYRELRRELESEGIEFRTDSDTEVILRAYKAWGPRAIGRLEGMFGLCLVDLDARKFLLARDHFGIKPLYYSKLDDCLGFASEPRALLEMMQAKPRLRSDKAIEYLAAGFDEHGTGTFFEGINKLSAGSYAIGGLDAPDELRFDRYWAAEDLPQRDRMISTPAKIRDLFLQSVEHHLRADVPVGILLSGGIDSSAVACAARIVAPRQELHTFTFSADDPAVNETGYARIVNQHIGGVEHLCEVQLGSFSERAEHTVTVLGEPVRGMAAVASAAVFEGVRATGLKVVLSGQGSDELLAGYTPYEAIAFMDCLRRRRVRAGATRLVNLHRQGKLRLVLGLSGKEALASALPGLAARLIGGKLRGVLSHKAWRQGESVLATYYRSRETDLRCRLGQDVAGNQLLGILRAEDRLAMASSIESRVPFLSASFVRSVQASVPGQLVDDEGTTKSVFREAMAGIVPDVILQRRDKFGYTGPEAEWAKAIARMLSGELDHMIQRDAGFLRRDVLCAWQRGGIPITNYRLLWSLYNLFAWIRIFDVEVSREAFA
jgi:asparagine synthase (glutamine-hydrolysing)